MVGDLRRAGYCSCQYPYSYPCPTLTVNSHHLTMMVEVGMTGLVATTAVVMWGFVVAAAGFVAGSAAAAEEGEIG